MTHFVWLTKESRKNVVNRFVRLYLDEFVDRGVFDRDKLFELFQGVVTAFYPAETQTGSVFLASRIEMNWVEGDAEIYTNCYVLSQEYAHYILWKLGRSPTIWHDKVHERWEEGKNIKFIIKYFNWRKLRNESVMLWALDVFDL